MTANARRTNVPSSALITTHHTINTDSMTNTAKQIHAS